MNDTVEYRPLPIEIDDLLRLKAAAGDRDRNLRLMLLRTDVGEMHIAVMTKGVEEPLYTVRHAEAETGKEGARPPKPCWLVHPSNGDGPMYEFPAVVDVANFLAFGDAQRCKRSWMTGRSEPGLIVGGELPEVGRKEAPETAPGGPRGRYLPMLGDRAGGVSFEKSAQPTAACGSMGSGWQPGGAKRAISGL